MRIGATPRLSAPWLLISEGMRICTTPRLSAPWLLLISILSILSHFPLASGQQDSTSAQCRERGAGYYYQSELQSCLPCPAGSYCPVSSSPLLQPIPCPAGTYQPLSQQGACLPCPENSFCSDSIAGTVTPTPCPYGKVSARGSPACTDCDYERFYYNAGSDSCVLRNVTCNLDTHYEVPDTENQAGQQYRTRERVCAPLSPPCDTQRLPAESPIFGDPPGAVPFAPLKQYIVAYNTRYSDRQCWTWRKCSEGSYVEQLPEDDGKVID